MAGEFPHLTIDPFFKPHPYVYPNLDVQGPELKLAERNRAQHGAEIIRQLNSIKDQFEIDRAQQLPQNIVRDDAVYVEFISDWDFSLNFDSFNSDAATPKYQLVNIKKEVVKQGDETKERFKVVVMMTEGGVSTFLKKAAQYLTDNTKNRDGQDTGLPTNRNLITNIETIQLAALQAFWSDEPEIPFPSEDEIVWWEVWFRRTDNDEERSAKVFQNLEGIGATIGQQTLVFPEHVVKLVKASARQLSGSLILLDNLAELRKPQQLNDFITNRNIDLQDKQQWLEDLVNRTDAIFDDRSVVICLLDSGVNNKHPLLQRFLPDNRMYTFNPAWGTNDSWEDGGHGTGMSGLSIYGDLTVALSNRSRIKILHGLESYKLYNPADPHDEQMYGAVTELACNTPAVDFPNNPRIYCLSITDRSTAFHGRPSAWSAAIDKIAMGITLETPQLFVVSGGNVEYMQQHIDATHFSSLNDNESIHDPGQSYNALTVGTYTRMDRIDQNTWPGITALAPNGGIAPSNSTSLFWDSIWPVKPDIVMEGGNLGVRGTQIMDNIPTLKPLSLDKEFTTYIFNPFGDTSGAAALASKMAAELMTAYPHYWPETIKGLIVHSADWTGTMLNGINLNTAKQSQKRSLLRTFGYGVPSAEKAFYNAKNSLTLIAQNSIQPYRMVGSSVKTNDYHLYDLPWPVDILQNYLTEKDVKLTVTLSYFIEPNPGNRRYSNNFSYQSHGLDFKMIKPTEDIEEFKRRVSAAEENLNASYSGTEEPWLLKEGLRNKGGIKKDFIVSSGADLATRHTIAIYPKRGWYFTRKRLGLADTLVRYSLIMSIESEDLAVDIYNPVEQLIKNTIPV